MFSLPSARDAPPHSHVLAVSCKTQTGILNEIQITVLSRQWWLVVAPHLAGVRVDVVHGAIETLPPSPLALEPSEVAGWLACRHGEVLGVRRCIERHNERLGAVAMVEIEVDDDGSVDVVLEVRWGVSAQSRRCRRTVHGADYDIVDVAESEPSACMAESYPPRGLIFATVVSRRANRTERLVVRRGRRSWIALGRRRTWRHRAHVLHWRLRILVGGADGTHAIYGLTNGLDLIDRRQPRPSLRHGTLLTHPSMARTDPGPR